MIALALLIAASAARQIPPQQLAAPLPAHAGSRTVTPDWLLSVVPSGYSRLGVRWMPDGKHLLLTLPPVVGQRVTQLALLDVKTGRRTPLGAGEAPVPSPDGKLIAHFRSEHDTIQLWVMGADGSAPRQLSHVPGGFNGFAGLTYAVSWSPDGRRVVLSHQPWVRPENTFAGASGDTTRTSALEEDQLVREAPKSELRLIDVATGRDSLLAAFDAHVRDVSWTPDASELVFFFQRVGFLYRQEQDECRIRAIRLKDGRLRTIAAPEGLQQVLGPELSPDGRKVAFAYDADNPIFNFMLSIGLADATPSADTSAKPIVRLTHEAKLQHQRWSPDGRRIYALRSYGIYRQVYAIDPASGALTQITHEPLVIQDYAISPNGRQLVWFGQDAHARQVLRIGGTNGTEARELYVFESAPDDIAQSEVREIEWAVPDYPVPLRGLLIMPLGYVQGTRYPVIADIHGGGAGASGDLAGALFVNTPLEWQLWAAKGYMVFVPELRSSGAFGSKAITEGVMRDNNEVAEDVNDVVAGVDTLVARGLVDSDRTIAIGNSAGGRRANWLTVATHRFRAVLSKEGWADDFFGAGIFMTGRVNTMYGGPPVEVPEHYQRNSAVFHARGATTPTLFMMGGRDHGSVDQLQTVHWLYNALRSQGVEAKYVTYPDEGHGFERPANRRDALERAMTWIDDHVKPIASAPAPASSQGQWSYPPTRTVDQVDDYHGTKVSDPYRWLEDDTSAATAAWVKAQNELTFGYLAKLPTRAELRRRLEAVYDYPKYSTPFRRGPYLLFQKNAGLQNQFVLYAQTGEQGTPHVLIDPNTLSSDGTTRLTAARPSRKADYLAYGLSHGGSDWQEYFVKRMATNRDLPDRLRWIKVSDLAWRGDGFYYSRYPAPPDTTNVLSAKNENHQVWYHRVGTPQSADSLVYADSAHPQRFHIVSTTEDERFAILSIEDRGAGKDGNAIYALDARKPGGRFVPVVTEFDDHFDVVDNQDDKLLVMTDRKAPHWRLVLIDPAHPSEANWKDVIPERPERLDAVHAAGGKLFAVYLKDAAHRVYVLDRSGKLENQIQLPTIGLTVGFTGRAEDQDVFWSFTGFTVPTTIYRYRVATRTSTVFRKPDVKFDPAKYETKQVFFPSKDGTKIPMFIVHRRGLALDGKNPTLIYGYGGFNISLGPWFDPLLVPLLERGVVYALVNLRGGGEYGEAWHEAGWRDKKQNVFDDFIAAAEWLQANGYTSKDRCALQGGSNGGLLVGAVMTQRPDLCKVALPEVGVMDMLRFQRFTIGWNWAAEYGSSDNPKTFPVLLRYSPLHNIKEGVTYPATLVTTADHDDRVVPAHSFKFIATLQAKGRGPNPYLIRIETRSGHGAVSTTKRLDETADVDAFMLTQLSRPSP